MRPSLLIDSTCESYNPSNLMLNSLQNTNSRIHEQTRIYDQTTGATHIIRGSVYLVFLHRQKSRVHCKIPIHPLHPLGSFTFRFGFHDLRRLDWNLEGGLRKHRRRRWRRRDQLIDRAVDHNALGAGREYVVDGEHTNEKDWYQRTVSTDGTNGRYQRAVSTDGINGRKRCCIVFQRRWFV